MYKRIILARMDMARLASLRIMCVGRGHAYGRLRTGANDNLPAKGETAPRMITKLTER